MSALQVDRKAVARASIDDEIFTYDDDEQQAIRSTMPWRQDPMYFKTVKMSALAMLKMVMHAAKGSPLEIMGLMTGKVIGNTIIVLDAFASPAIGSETRVNAGTREFEYIAQYLDLSKNLGRLENCIGWYHSHPGYGCWLSGIDVNTQRENQQFQDPWLAVVVDPVATVSSGKVEIGSFRTYPPTYKPPNAGPSAYQTVPEDKIEDFGVHHDCYYVLPTELFKSSTDEKLLNLLWNKYWVKTLSSSPLIANRDFCSKQIRDVSTKMRRCENELSKRFHYYHHMEGGKKKGGADEMGELAKINQDNVKLTTEVINGLIGLELKKTLFNIRL